MDLDRLIALETNVWRALVDGDARSDAAALAPDFLGVYPTGFGDRDDHVAQLACGPTVTGFVLSDARMLVVSDGAALLAYRAEYERPASPGVVEAMYVASLWCERDGTWVNVFSQDTPDTGIEVP